MPTTITTNNKIKLVPKLRFKGYEDEWVKMELKAFINFISGYAFNSSEMKSTKSKYQLLKMSNIYKSELQLERSPSYWGEIDTKLEKYLLKEKDIILTLTGTVGKTDYGYSIVIPENNRFLINQRLVCLRYILNVSDGDFINNLIKTSRFFYLFFGESKGGTGNQTNVGIEDLRNIKLPVPTLPEQQKIATFLSSVDEKIQQLTRKKELLEQYKKGVMQQLFSGKLRFKDENGKSYPKWEEKRLGDCLDYIQPTKYLVSSTEYDDSYTTPVLTAGKTFILGYTNETNNIFNENLPVILFDDFTTATQFVDFPFKAKSSAMKILVAKENENINYIYEAMRLIKFEIGGHGRHWISQFANFMIPYPSLPEQEKIATYLTTIDKKIETIKKEITATQGFKKGLLQQMFV